MRAPRSRGTAPRQIAEEAPAVGVEEAWLDRAAAIARAVLAACPPDESAGRSWRTTLTLPAGPDRNIALSCLPSMRAASRARSRSARSSSTATGDSRISGSFASLAGLERAPRRGDAGALEDAIARILLGHALILGWDGLPLLYMGDEIGLLNDRGYRRDPGHASDNRWIHRPVMDWARAATRHGDGPVGRIFRGTQRLVTIRRSLEALHAATPLDVLDLGDPWLFASVRSHPSGPLLAVHNMTETPCAIPGRSLEMVGLQGAVDAIAGGEGFEPGAKIPMPGYAARWLVAAEPPCR